MKIAYEYSHFGGSEVLEVNYPDIDKDINQILLNIRLEEFSEIDIITHNIHDSFNKKGYKRFIEKVDINIPGSDIIVRNVENCVSFVKDKVFIEVRFDRYEMMFYDMVRFHYFHGENKADVGVEIVPCHNLKKHMSTGVSYGEQLVYDIERLKRHFPAVPVKLILVDADE